MSLKLTDVRCPHCGKKFCEEIAGGPVRVVFRCERCKRQVIFEEGMPKTGKPTE